MVIFDAIGMVAADMPAEATIRSFAPDDEREPGQSHTLAARCDSPAELDALVARLVALGHRVVREPWDADWGQRYATVEDPDGYGVDLYASLPPG